MKMFTKMMSLVMVFFLSSSLIFGQANPDQFKVELMKKNAVPVLVSGPIKSGYIPAQTDDVLWSQMSPSDADGACASQDFEAANDIYDCRGADDFTVTSGPWEVSVVSFIGAYWNATPGGPADGFNIEFFNDAAGVPGTSVQNYSNLAYTAVPSGASFIFTVNLPAPLILANGNYWIAMQARMDFTPGGQFGLLPQLPPQIQYERMWICPGGGFPGATTWTPGTAIWPGQAGKDWCFQLEGSVGGVLDPPTNLTLNLSGSNVVLNWDAPSGKSFSNNVPIQELPLTVTTELTNSVHNNLLNEYKQSGQEIKAEQLISNSKAPVAYKTMKLDVKGATAYCCVAYDPSSVLPIGPATFDTDFPGTITSLAPGTSGDFIAGGSWAEGVWYGEEYGTGALYTIDPSSGAMSLVGYGSAAGGFNAIAYDVTTSTMFGCDYNGSSCGLYSIDLSSGANTYIGDVGLGALVIGLACDASGNLYAADLFTDVLISVDKATGAGTVIGPLGININYAQDLEYDNENDVLYLAGYTATGELYTVDPSTGDATFVGTFQGGAEICGLAFEYNAVQYTNDIGIQSILSPASGVNLGNEVVTVRIKNFGTAAQSNFNISYTLDGGTPVNATITNSIAGGATYDYTFTGTVNLSAYGTYEFVACTYLTGDENAVNDCKPKSVTNSEPSLCVPQYGTGCAFGDGFTDFVLAEIQNNGSGCADLNGIGWSQYFNLGPAMLSAGGTYDVIMTGGYDGTFASMWIDFNDDLVLSSDEEIFIGYELVTMGVPYTVSITIPANAPSGQHVMRARTSWLSAATDPCALYTYGEAEDYIVQVGGGTGLLGYNVYHASGGGSFSVLDFVTPTTYTHVDPPLGLHEYYVTAVYDSGESEPTNTVSVVLTGVQESVVESTQIYPNPASAVVNIKSEYSIVNVKVYNYAGQVIASELADTKFYQFNTSKFTPGLYMFQIETNEGTITKRIIVE